MLIPDGATASADIFGEAIYATSRAGNDLGAK